MLLFEVKKKTNKTESMNPVASKNCNCRTTLLSNVLYVLGKNEDFNIRRCFILNVIPLTCIK